MEANGGSALHLIPMVQALRSWAAEHPDASALTVDDQTLTYAELDERTDRVARALAELGVAEGDYVTIALPNSADFVISAVALLKLGAVIQPVSSGLPAPEREAIVELAGSKLVIGADSDRSARYVPDIWSLHPADPARPLPDAPVSRPWRATTSGGSTGRPKLIVGTASPVVDLDKPDYLLPQGGVVMIPGPLYHGGPFLIGMTSLFHGNHLVLKRRFDAEGTVALADKLSVSYLLLVPTMMHRIWRLDPSLRRTSLPELRILFHLASSCPRWLKEAWLGWLGPERVYELYGASDAPNRTIISGIEWLAHPGSVGLAKPGEFKICDESGAELPPGQAGEIWMRPPPGQENRSYVVGADARTLDGWTSVGDIGWLDDDRYLYIADRRTDMINTGGENVFPAEVEAALEMHPGVCSSAVIGVPDDDLGHRVHAIVEVERGVTEDDLRTHMLSQLAPYKTPRTYELTFKPIRDEAGKVRKSALRNRRAGA
jgi:bile acid-coenzyme A ligase